jgi:glycosyltransferase involved in cell wall biosynthesis
MRILHAYNQHRGGGGSDNATRSTIEVQREHGLDVQVYTRSSEDLPKNLRGRLQAASSVVYAPTSVREFGRLLESFRPDVVHAHEVFPLVSPWILPLCRDRGVPVAMSCVDYRMTCPIVTHLRGTTVCTECTGGREYRAVLRNCRQNLPESVAVASYNFLVRKRRLFRDHVSRFIAPSEFTRRWLIQHAAIAPESITTVAPVVAIPACASDPGEGRYVAYAGRITPEKGIATLLDAARLCDAPFRLARAENSLVTMDVPPGPAEMVVTRTREDLDAFFHGARMLVVPSLWFETFGLVAAEAMAWGLPVIASRLGSLSHLVEDGVDGLLFDPGNPQDLAAKVSRLWTDAALCRRLGRAARTKAMSLWTARQHVERLMGVYTDLMGAA